MKKATNIYYGTTICEGKNEKKRKEKKRKEKKRFSNAVMSFNGVKIYYT
jgi:hypothetical protein